MFLISYMYAALAVGRFLLIAIIDILFMKCQLLWYQTRQWGTIWYIGMYTFSTVMCCFKVLASSILNFCRGKRSFQWCPDQSDRPNGAWDTHKNAQTVEWKTRSKISYTWMLHAKNYPSRWRFLRSFLTASKPSRTSITAAKTREKEKKERRKKIPKIERPKDVGRFLLQSLDFCSCLSHNALKRDTGGKKGKLSYCKQIFDRIKGNLAEIQPKNHQNVQKTHFLQNVPGVNDLIEPGGYLTKCNMGRLRPEVQPLTLLYTIVA